MAACAFFTALATASIGVAEAQTACSQVAADLIFVMDISPSFECPESMQQYTTTLVDGLSAAIGPDGVRVAAVTFSRSAEVQFAFHTTNGVARAAAEVKEQLQRMPTAGEGPTFAHTGFDLVRTELLVDRNSAGIATGFRNFTVPVVLVIITDGKTVNSGDMVAAFDHDVFNREAMTRMVFDVGGNAENNLLGVMATGPGLVRVRAGVQACALCACTMQLCIGGGGRREAGCHATPRSGLFRPPPPPLFIMRFFSFPV